MIARSTIWGTIQFGDEFYRLTELEQCAIVAHEQGHIFHRHALKRLWWLLSLQWKGFFERCEKQEIEADKYAVMKGHFTGLSTFLMMRHDLDAKPVGYPSARQRLDAIYYG